MESKERREMEIGIEEVGNGNSANPLCAVIKILAGQSKFAANM